MTLVGRFHLGGNVFLVGDVLVTGKREDNWSRSLPTIGNRQFQEPAPNTKRPVSLTQKLAILGGKVALGWTGPVASARSLVSALQSAVHENTTTESLANAVSSLSNTMFDELHGVGSVLQSGKAHHFTIGDQVTKFSGDDVKNVALAGSGAIEAEKLLHQLANSWPAMTTGDLDPASEALCKCLGLTGVLLTMELRTGGTILNHFGGGYEIVIGGKDGFRRVEEVTYVFYLVDHDDTNNRWTIYPLQASKNSYLDDFLIIRTVPFKGTWKTGASLALHVVEPINKPWVEPGGDWVQSLPSLNSLYLCHYFMIRSKGERDGEVIAAAMKQEDHPIHFLERDRPAADGEPLVTMAINSERMLEIVRFLQVELGGEVGIKCERIDPLDSEGSGRG